MKVRKSQRGIFIVEFAIIAVVMGVVLFAAIELSRMIWVWNTVDEATRRGARLAAVCEIGYPTNVPVEEATVFSSGGANSPILRGLTTANVAVEYLDVDGTLMSAPAFEDVRYVRVRIENYSVTPIIPFFNLPLTLPIFETTLPSESLGYIPDSAPPDFGCI